MQKELSYLNEQGATVFTSQFHRNRGTCCKSACLHCPYGFTIKKCGLHFQDIEEKDFQNIEDILLESDGLFDWKSFWPENVKFIVLKDQICGLMFKNHIVIKHLILRPQFKDQGISKELVESYFFI